MKKIVLVPAILGVMGIGGVIAVAGGNNVGSAEDSKKLTIEEIEKKALTEVKGTIREIEFETEGTRSFYEIEVVTKDAEYDLKIDAFTGEVLRKKKEVQDDDDFVMNNVQNAKVSKNLEVNAKMDDDNIKSQSSKTQIQSTNNSKILSVEEIKKRALAEVKGTIREIEFETEGTRSFYETEVVTKDAEYNLKIDAFTGKLLKKEKESLNGDDKYNNDDHDEDFNDNDDDGYMID